MSSPKISIIIPVYQTKNSLPASLDSLLAQCFRDMEIIVIDDASPDAAGEIALEYARRDKRIKVVANPSNLGLYASRFVGSAVARGKYIAFCDSDDRMPVGAVEALYETAEAKQADIVHGRARELADHSLGARLRVYDPFSVATGLEFSRAILRNARGWNIWGKLYRLDAWNRATARLPMGKRLFLAEDLLISFALGLESGRYAETGETVYLYRRPENNYFADPAQALMRVAELLDVLLMVRDMAVTVPESSGLMDSAVFLVRYIVRAMLRALPESPDLRNAALEEIQARFGNDVFASMTNHRQWHPCAMAARIREYGAREFFIALDRFWGAARQRGWRRVLNEVWSL